jgi:hypothetical protein
VYRTAQGPRRIGAHKLTFLRLQLTFLSVLWRQRTASTASRLRKHVNLQRDILCLILHYHYISLYWVLSLPVYTPVSVGHSIYLSELCPREKRKSDQTGLVLNCL